ncbi:UDP-N-acetylmuramate--L-alanine ligase [uncultured Muribaculum sp.]|uniref:UDP-N-acetylmuramate--L-alanine ligase n=1 Tax=uncultured Muribaculum sp. TaxID=1918613 RepID=UPI00272D9046|nr:UDP-N-acetylmuramate--L-alanine ligase [uncultured Muribaculum sp.]
MSHKKIYFAGAGGIGMAALERYFLAKGCRVAGYDRTPTELTRALQDEGVEITFDESVEAIPADFKGCPEEVLVVYTPALPDMHPGLSYFRENGYEVVKRAAVLGNITRDTKGLCFAGTHGKTTTSSMAAHILNTCKVGCNAFLGGILRNYNSNLLLSATSPYSVIEADEYDRSFHHLRPYIAVITATDPDHLDIYGTEEAYLESFAHFTELINPGGMLVVHEDLKLKPRVPEGVKSYTYSRDKGDFHAENVRRGNGEITFDIVTPSGTVRDITLGVPVEINIENAIAAFAACYLTGDIEIDAARDAIASFMGPKRRFEFWLKEPGAEGRAIIDDYAHHPDELKASIKSVKALYPGRRLTVAFQPHLYSRTRDFAPEFAASLSLADEVILLDIYPAREEPIPGVTSEIIFNDIKCKDKVMIDKQHLTETIKNRNFEILLTVGAGDICNYLPEIVKNVNLR